jgi:preprotein translocase subunit Sec61beta
MSKKKKKDSGSGLMSSAGLMRYFDTEESAVKIPPETVVVSAIFAAVAITALNMYYGLWP